MKQNQHESDCCNSATHDGKNKATDCKNIKNSDATHGARTNDANGRVNNSSDCCNKCSDCGMTTDKEGRAVKDKAGSSHAKPKRYKCKNCGTIHDCGTPPKNCCKCDCSDFTEI